MLLCECVHCQNAFKLSQLVIINITAQKASSKLTYVQPCLERYIVFNWNQSTWICSRSICSEAAGRMYFVQKMWSKMSQDLQENTLTRVSFLIKSQSSTCNYFSVNFTQILRLPFLQNTCGQLLLNLSSRCRKRIQNANFSGFQYLSADLETLIQYCNPNLNTSNWLP